MKKILFATSEAVPFIKTGGLADVTGSLPKYINKEEFDVRIILPKYLCMNSRFEDQLCFKCHLWVELGWRKQYVGIYETKQDGVTYYFVDNEFYFAGDKPYNQIYEDIEKFAFFSKAVLEALPYIDFCPEIIHCHDWQTGLIPVFLRTLYGSQEYYAGMRTVFSIHNLKFQGRWMLSEVKDITGLPPHIFTDDKLEAYGEANYLKGGLVYANAITTVSKTYANEIMTPEGGEGLHGLLSARSNDVYGIVNGLDYDVFNSETDPGIAKNFKVTNVKTGKKANKLALQKEFALPEEEGTYLMGMVGRLTDQKGLDLVAYIMEELLQTAKIQIIVLGTGEGRYEEMFRYFENKYPNQIKAYIGYSEELAHRIYASCDSFLMPSLFEPCGLSQLMSMRYGTLPIVRETGGLKDTVEAYNEYEHTGTGFSFKNYNAHEMLDTIRYSLKVYYDDRKEWDAMVKRAMKQDFSWERSAREYEELYKRY
ncbi:MAG: glycogen synthase GlgA [Roseburia sp.]|nr:glycogen synthase GlgA [Roseburia sp.]